jgi:hypothetical protein
MRRIPVVVLFANEIKSKEPTRAPAAQIQCQQDIERVQWYLIQRWNEFARQNKRMPKTFEASAHLHACYEASLQSIQRFTSGDSLYEGTPISLYFKSSKLYVNPDLRGFDLRIS